jgi:hypothetical protein
MSSTGMRRRHNAPPSVHDVLDSVVQNWPVAIGDEFSVASLTRQPKLVDGVVTKPCTSVVTVHFTQR